MTKIEKLKKELEQREAAVAEVKEQMRELQQSLAVGAANDLMKSFDSFMSFFTVGAGALSFAELQNCMALLKSYDDRCLKVLASDDPYGMSPTPEFQYFVGYVATPLAEGRDLFEVLLRIKNSRGVAGNPIADMEA